MNEPLTPEQIRRTEAWLAKNAQDRGDTPGGVQPTGSAEPPSIPPATVWCVFSTDGSPCERLLAVYSTEARAVASPLMQPDKHGRPASYHGSFIEAFPVDPDA